MGPGDLIPHQHHWNRLPHSRLALQFCCLLTLSPPPVPGLRIHCQSFHNFIAHLCLHLDAKLRGACFTAYKCTCIPHVIGVFSEVNNYLTITHLSTSCLLRVSEYQVRCRENRRDIALQSMDIRGAMYDTRQAMRQTAG